MSRILKLVYFSLFEIHEKEKDKLLKHKLGIILDALSEIVVFAEGDKND
jgi:hypothetical protein